MIVIIIISGVSIARGETREHAAVVNLIICGEVHANEAKGEWRWALRKDLAEQCSYVMCRVILSCFSLFLLTRLLHLNAWQQAAEERYKKTKVGSVWERTIKKKKKGVKNRREEEVILWATVFRMAGLSWEISVKRARELFSCFPLFRDISCGILLFSVTGILWKSDHVFPCE